MSKLGYHDFHYRKLTVAKRVKLAAIPETKEAFLRRIDAFLTQGDKRLINVETREEGIRVWYCEG